MEKWQCTPVLQNEIREHEAHEKEIIESARRTLKVISQYEYELYPINTMDDVVDMLNRICEQDKLFKHITSPDTVTGAALRMIEKECRKWIDTAHILKSKWDYEENVLRDNQGKEDKVIFYLNSIDQSVQSIKETQNKIPSTDPQAPEKEIMPEWRKHLIHKGFVYPPDGKRVIQQLNDTVLEYVSHTKQSVTRQFIQENFRKADGKEYSRKSCDQARDIANTRK
jgi:hypothetical protein